MRRRLFIRPLPALVALVLFVSMHAAFGERWPTKNPPVLEGPLVDSQRDSPEFSVSSTPSVEWEWHKTEDGAHPSGEEQAMMWLMNRARSNPLREGIFLSDTGDSRVASAVRYFNVDLVKMQAEFAAIAPMPPAAFDRRIYEGSRVHSLDLIARDAQDHNNQFGKVSEAGFSSRGGRASVFSYSRSPLHAHAGFNIDWGGGTSDGMQTGRGHRVGLMSTGTNVGIAMESETDPSTSVGPLVTSIAYLNANTSAQDHFNKFIVGTVWNDDNGNGRYDSGEGLSGVEVMPDTGTYFAVTGLAGGYAIPVTVDREYTLNFSGGELSVPAQRSVTIAGKSALAAWIAEDTFEVSTGGPLAVPFAPALTCEVTPEGVEVSWAEDPNFTYTLESRTSDSEWSQDNRSIEIDGAIRSFVISGDELAKLFRLRVEN